MTGGRLVLWAGLLASAVLAHADDSSRTAWLQWGGPNQDFKAPASEIASSWPESGPEELWSRPLGDGYSAILFEDGRLYTMYRDGREEVVICLDANNGETVWEFRYEHAPWSRGQRGYGVGPRSTPLIAGELRWHFPHANQWGHNITMPVVRGGNTVFLSSPQIGARGLRLAREGEKIEIEEVWSSRRVQFYHGSSVMIGDWVYGSTGMTSPAFMTAINIRTGEIGWRERGLAKANCVEADGKLVILDEDGMLYLATATPERLLVHSKTQLFDQVAWTVPTIVGQTLYARDNQQILALDLG